MLFSAEVPKEPRCAQGRHCGVGDASVTDARCFTAFSKGLVIKALNARLQNPLGSCLVIGWIFIKIDFYRQFE